MTDAEKDLKNGDRRNARRADLPQQQTSEPGKQIGTERKGEHLPPPFHLTGDQTKDRDGDTKNLRYNLFHFEYHFLSGG